MGIGVKWPKKHWNAPLTAFEFKNFLQEDPQTPLQKTIPSTLPLTILVPRPLSPLSLALLAFQTFWPKPILTPVICQKIPVTMFLFVFVKRFKWKDIFQHLQVEFSPTLKQLATIVGSIAGYLTQTISDIKRLPDILTRKKSNKDVSVVQLFMAIFSFFCFFSSLNFLTFSFVHIL